MKYKKTETFIPMQHKTQLIKGEFKKERAQTLVNELISYKIQFHGIEKFSNEERFGKDLEYSEKRINELKKEKSDLMDWLNSIDENELIDIKCEIHLRIK